jgi:uncharacterized membrane protein
MSYRIAGIDVHKKMLAVVVSDVEVDGEYHPIWVCGRPFQLPDGRYTSDCSPEWNHNRWSITGRTVSESFTGTLVPAALPP